MAEKLPWDLVRARLLTEVFSSFDPSEVDSATDLGEEGLLDSLAMVTAITILAVCSGNGAAIKIATMKHFRTFASIKAFYEGL